MAFVLDASTALNLILPEESATAASRAIADAFETGETAVVPSLWLLEISNVLLVSERSGRLGQGHGDRLLEGLLALPIKVAPEAFGGAPRTLETLRLARDRGLSAYDGAYLWLARSQNLPLATGDQALTQAATKSGVRLL